MPMLPVGQELLLFLDQERNLCLIEQRVEWRTNYSHLMMEPGALPDAWLRQVRFLFSRGDRPAFAASNGVLVQGG